MLATDSFFAGDSITIEFIVEENDIAQNISLFTAKLKLSPLGERYKLLEKTGVVDATTTGKVTFNLLPNDTIDFEEGYYTYQMTISQGVTNSYTSSGELYFKGAIL